jgi:hypothetical protein
MDVMEAVKAAADYVAELEGMTSVEGESNERILRNIRFAVEGTRYDERERRWNIDVGFARPWDQATSSPLAGLAGSIRDNRTFKTVTIDDATGKVLAYGASK